MIVGQHTLKISSLNDITLVILDCMQERNRHNDTKAMIATRLAYKDAVISNCLIVKDDACDNFIVECFLSDISYMAKEDEINAYTVK